MIAKTHILQNLKQLNSRFLRSRTSKEGLYFSKLAVMELCGWIEISMDDLLLRIAQRKLKESNNRDWFSKEVVDKNYGFKYKSHLRSMLIRLVGIITVEKIEKKVDQGMRTRLESELGNLTTVRNSLAHTFVRGTQVQIDAPSVTIARVNRLYDGLKEFERVIFKLL